MPNDIAIIVTSIMVLISGWVFIWSEITHRKAVKEWREANFEWKELNRQMRFNQQPMVYTMRESVDLPNKYEPRRLIT